MRYNEKIRRLRTARGLTLDRLGELLGIHRTQITRYEKGERTRGPWYDEALAYARFFRVPVEWLCDDDADWPPPVGASEKEQALYLLIRTMGPDEALARLAGLPPGAPAGPGLIGQVSPRHLEERRTPPEGEMRLEPGPPRPRIRKDRDGG